MQTLVFLTRHMRYSYLYVGETDRYKYFLTLQSGTIDLERHGQDSEFVKKEIVPYSRCSLKHAAKIYSTSTLGRTDKAAAVISAILKSKDSETRFIAPQVGKSGERERLSKQERSQLRANTLSLKQLAAQVGITSQHLRSLLRRSNLEKPGGRWAWPKSQSPALIKQIKNLMKS